MRNDYLQAAQNVIPDPMVLINVVSKRVKQLKFGEKPLVSSLEKLEPEDIVFREIIEGKITFKIVDEK
jgi:DNA-directed RNA polymerase subunit omega